MVSFENTQDTIMEGEVAEFVYKCSEQKQPKRKRSFSVFDEDNEDMIDKAFRSRLVNKLAFSHRISSELDLFEHEIESMSRCWQDFNNSFGLKCKDDNDFINEGDQAIKSYISEYLSCIEDQQPRSKTQYADILTTVSSGVNLAIEHQRQV